MSLLDGPEYTALRQEIGRLLESEHSVSRQAVEQERVRAYWEVGQRLHQVLPAPKGRGYGRHILGRLAVDLDIRERLLYEMVQFYRSFEQLPTSARLGWSH